MKSHLIYSLLLCLGLAVSACKIGTDSKNDFAAFDVDEFSLDESLDVLSKTSDDIDEDANTSNVQMTNDLNGLDKDINTVIDAQSFSPRPLNIPFCDRRVYFQVCRTDGEKSYKGVKYDSCLLPGTKIIATGFVKLEYNNATCSMLEDGNEVNRTYLVALDHVRRGSLLLTTTPTTNYLGDELSGGGTLLNTAEGWQIEVLGNNRKFIDRFGRLRADVSVQTENPIEVTGTLSKKDRTVNGGALLVHHNKAKFTVAYTPEDLHWQEGCKCPVSGALNIEYSGSKNGTGKITFPECGVAIISRNDGEKTVKLRACLDE